jgi:hypothetical protein
MPMHIAARKLGGSLYCFFLYLKVFVCFIKQACLLEIVSKFGVGGDDSILHIVELCSTKTNHSTFC